MAPRGESGTGPSHSRELVRRLVEDAFGKGDLTVLSEVLATNYVGHFVDGDHYGQEGVRIELAAYRKILQDFTATLDDLFGDETKVARRFTLRGTYDQPGRDGRRNDCHVTLRGLAIDQIEDGIIVESWVLIDPLPTDDIVLEQGRNERAPVPTPDTKDA